MGFKKERLGGKVIYRRKDGTYKGQGKTNPPKSIYDAHNMSELRSVLNQRGIALSNDIDDLKFNEVRDAVGGALYVLEEFGIEDGYLKGFGVKNRGVMCATLDGEINFNKGYFKEGTADVSVVMNGSSFHPKNQNAFTTASHEAGHILESYIVKKETGVLNNNSPSFMAQLDMIDAWNKGKYSSKIISDASKNAKREYKKQYGGSQPTIAKMISDVSGYATKNRSECFAECIADYVANGENASILAKEVWKTTKKYFNK